MQHIKFDREQFDALTRSLDRISFLIFCLTIILIFKF